jgi:molecular chaperone GrpE
MFFKKKKIMKDKTNSGAKNADNLSQKNEKTDETIDNVLNADSEDNKDDVELEEVNGEEIEKLRAEVAELKDKHLRMVAEFDNFRRRTAKERLELVQTAGKDTIQSLLVVLDDMDRAAKQLENTKDNLLKEGVSLVFNKLRATLQQKGLKAMEAKNEEFNPDLHEAITEIPAPTEEMKGKIIDVVEAGYYLNDKLIRHAKVVVGK